MHQNNIGFLGNLYRGTLRADLYNMNSPSADEKKVASFIEKYRKVVSAYAPLNLEKLGIIPDDLMKGLKDIGIFGLTVPKEYGGLGFTLTEYLRVVEEMSCIDAALVLMPLAHLSIGIKAIMLFGNEQQKQTYLTKASSGEMVFAYALTEPQKGSDAQHIDSVAICSEDGSHYTLNGKKTYITNGSYAGGFTVFAQLDNDKQGRMGAFIIEKSWDGVSVGKDMPKMGLKVSSTTPVSFNDVKVPKENLIGNEGDGFKIAMNVLNYGRLALGASAFGGMKQSLKDMLGRSRKRVQFSVPIKSFELIQEKMVRAHAHAFATSSMTYFTASLLEKEPLMNVAIESSHCKLYGTNECWNTLYDALQTAGGAGYISILPYEKRMRDARVTTIFEGTTEIHSIYAPLTLFRDYAKDLKKLSGISALMYIRSIASKRLLKQVHSSHPKLQNALKTACKSEAIFRKLASKGLVKYRKEIVNKEFFLRRMTELSLSLFMLVASVAYLQSTGTFEEADILALEYLIEEAKKTQQECNFVEQNDLEKIHHKMFSAIDASV